MVLFSKPLSLMYTGANLNGTKWPKNNKPVTVGNSKGKWSLHHWKLSKPNWIRSWAISSVDPTFSRGHRIDKLQRSFPTSVMQGCCEILTRITQRVRNMFISCSFRLPANRKCIRCKSPQLSLSCIRGECHGECWALVSHDFGLSWDLWLPGTHPSLHCLCHLLIYITHWDPLCRASC